MPLRSTSRRPLVVGTERLRLLLCDAPGTLFPCADDGSPTAPRPDPDVLGALAVLEQRFSLAALAEPGPDVEELLAGCGMAAWFPERLRAGSPDTVDGYRRAAAEAGALHDEGLAVAATARAVRAATEAGFAAVGNLQYVAPAGRPARHAELVEAGAVAVVTSWEHLLVTLLD